MGLTQQQMTEIENKYRAFKILYCSDLTLTTGHVLTDGEVAQIESRINLLKQIIKSFYSGGRDTDASIITHLIGDLRSRVLMNKRMREMDTAGELERWKNLSEGERNYESMIKNHPEWRVRSNPLLDMTGSIMEESQSTDVAVFQAAVTGAIIANAMSPRMATPTPATPGPIISRIAAFTGTRPQFRAWVLSKLLSEPNNPLRFLLDASGTGFKQVSSRAHSELINNPDVWEAGHITRDKLGGVRLMIQSAWENQVQNISVEHPRIGGAVLDNPAVEVGGIPVAKSTVKFWEQAGRLPAGTAERAPFCAWLLLGYFKTVPKELEEAARIDGASRLQTMWTIFLPLCTPGFISAGIFAFTLSQNEFLYALIFLTKSSVRTVPVGVISELIRGDVFYWGQLMAGALLGSIPVAIIYSFFVEHYVAGLTAGSVKA